MRRAPKKRPRILARVHRALVLHARRRPSAAARAWRPRKGNRWTRRLSTSSRSPARAARDAADDAAAAAAHARAAREILALADRHQRDGQLSVVEIETFLKGSAHEEFASWLLQRRAARFKTFDRDKAPTSTSPSSPTRSRR